MPRQTTLAKPGEIEPRWLHVDASGQVLGRLATKIATAIMGKHRPEWTPHVKCGDFVVVTNARNIVLTGRKAEQKVRKTYVFYPGGQKQVPYGEVLETHPERLIEDAVRRMLPKGRLGRQMIKQLKVYADDKHPHQAQQPVPLDTVMTSAA